MVPRDYGNPLSKGRFDIIAIGSSLGGIQAMARVLAPLPAYFPVPIVIVQHLAPNKPSNLAQVLSFETNLQVVTAQDRLVLQPGTVYVAPPNRHLIIQPGGVMSLTEGIEVHFSRPSATVLFQSVASVFRERAIGVILSGMGRDGHEGVRAIKKAGGRIIVQDQPTARAFSMPRTAIETGCYDFVLPINCIASALVTLTMAPGGADLFRVTSPLPYYLT